MRTTLDKESEEAYNKRQAEPLFKSAKEMIPMEQVQKHYENLLCGFNKRDGCQLLVRDRSYYACIWHQAIQSTGTDFEMYYNLLMNNENDLSKMSPDQFTKLEQKRVYEKAWMDNFPRGANMDVPDFLVPKGQGSALRALGLNR